MYLWHNTPLSDYCSPTTINQLLQTLDALGYLYVFISRTSINIYPQVNLFILTEEYFQLFSLILYQFSSLQLNVYEQ